FTQSAQAPFLLPVDLSPENRFITLKTTEITLMTMLRGTRIVTGPEAAILRETENRFRSCLHRSGC
ncbi:hypothetical protein, partial [Pseudomonas cannabina]